MNKTKLLYLASPFTYKGDDSYQKYVIESNRYRRITQIAADLTVKYGHAMFLPITQSYAMSWCNNKLKGDFNSWKNIDLRVIESVDEVWVVMMEDWTQSTGVLAEIQYAKKLKKKIWYIHPTTLKFYKSPLKGLK